MNTVRKYPVGIQTFERLRKENYLYIDKTDLIWKMTKESPFVFLSRPRRFGKSLLTTTLDSYFKGQKELFEGLKIMDLETEWEQYPVIHVDLSVAKAESSIEALRETLMWILKPMCEVYGKDESETSPGKMFSGLIHRAYEKTGKQVVVIIDEYDAPLLDKLHLPDLLDGFRNVMQEFFIQLKANEALIRFRFISGITIRDYDRESDIYTLGIPNNEVRLGFTRGLLPIYVGIDGPNVQKGFALKLWQALKKNDIDLAMQEMKAYFAGLPYVEGFQKKLAEVKNYEGFYEWSLYLIFSMLNVYVRTQVNVRSSESHSSLLENGRVAPDVGKANCAGGRTDVVVEMPDTTYVFELKVNGTAQEALDQINSKGYALSYETEGRKVVKVGVAFEPETMTVGKWVVG